MPYGGYYRNVIRRRIRCLRIPGSVPRWVNTCAGSGSRCACPRTGRAAQGNPHPERRPGRVSRSVRPRRRGAACRRRQCLGTHHRDGLSHRLPRRPDLQSHIRGRAAVVRDGRSRDPRRQAAADQPPEHRRPDDQRRQRPAVASIGRGDIVLASETACFKDSCHFRADSPFKAMRWAECTTRSKMASASLGSLSHSYQPEIGGWLEQTRSATVEHREPLRAAY